MPFTSAEHATQMIQQLRVLDPAISAEPGTPERKILDTVAVKLAESQLDLTALAGGLNIDSKFGSNLDKFLALFNFGRQKPVAATGFVTFSRPGSPAPRDIRVPAGSRVIAPDSQGDIEFRTTFDVTLKLGQTSVVAPIIAALSGSRGNVAANRISVLTNIEGVYAVTNELPTSGGISREEDDALKARFKNTVFRNVSGTTDQFLALAVATPFTTKANVIGPISRYREYVQVPATADDIGGNGIANEWTTALSTIPFSKHVYDAIPYFVSNGRLGAQAVFFRPNADFVLNTTGAARNRGDAYRQAAANPGEADWDPTNAVNAYRPSVTFQNVYLGSDEDVIGVRPGDVLLFEHSYMSSASRNDWSRNLTNCVDVFIDGGSNVVANAVIPRPTSANMFVNDPTHRYYFENFRRVGEHHHRPVIGNLVTPLFFQPVTDIPAVLTVNGYNYYEGYHYWLVEDISELGGTVRARNGIEWDKYLPGQQTGAAADAPETWTGPTIVYGDEGGETEPVAPSITVTGYTYDKNINDLQASFDSAKQTTTDVLAHRATTRYFKLDVTVMYAPGVSAAEANASIRAAVQDFFKSQYFGSTIQLSDLLNVVHNVNAVDNVRWSRDVPSVEGVGGTVGEIDKGRQRVIEANVNGTPHASPVFDIITWGSGARQQQVRLYIAGEPDAGLLTLTFNGSSKTFSYSADPADFTNPTTKNVNPANGSAAANLQTELRALTGDASLTVTGTGTPASPFIITFSTTGAKAPFTTTSTLTGGPTIFNTDFYLEDDQLPSLPDQAQPGDTVPGIVIRPRAQNTWVRL